VKDWLEQVTTTLLMFAVPIVPVPFATLQVCPLGELCTVTAYAVPAVSEFVNAKLVAPELTVNVTPLLASTKPAAARPLTVPPTV
jgi:hypothetical protein